MELRHLRSFAAVAQYLNYSEASLWSCPSLKKTSRPKLSCLIERTNLSA
jgi:hypothetical protein